MTAYVDSSALLRFILNQSNKLPEFSKLQRPISSKLLKVECLRALNRLKNSNELTEDKYLQATEDLYEGLDSVEFIEITDSILDRASGSFPFNLGTLDSIHLSSALCWKDRTHIKPIMMTHDLSLGRVAKALGFEVLGC